MPVATLLAHAALISRLVSPYPFAVGETLTYEATLGYFPIGTATASVVRTAKERGVDAWVFTAMGEGGPPGFKTRYEMTSWTQSSRLASLRFHRKLTQGGKVDEERYQIVPDSGRYRQEGVPRDWVAPKDALDELAYLYYLRTMPLEVGKSLPMSRYFKTGFNPIQMQVTGRESLTLFDGRTVPCLAIQLTTRGQTVAVWLTDDDRRLPAQLTLPLPYGNVTLVLTGVARAAGS